MYLTISPGTLYETLCSLLYLPVLYMKRYVPYYISRYFIWNAMYRIISPGTLYETLCTVLYPRYFIWNAMYLIISPGTLYETLCTVLYLPVLCMKRYVPYYIPGTSYETLCTVLYLPVLYMKRCVPYYIPGTSYETLCTLLYLPVLHMKRYVPYYISRCFICNAMYRIISRWNLLRIINVSHKSCSKIRTHILYPITCFWKSYRLWDNMEKYCRSGQTTDDRQNDACALHAG